MTYGETLACLNPCDPQTVAQILAPHLFPGASVADIGCGRGAMLRRLSASGGYVLYGAEPDEALCAQASLTCPDAEIACAGADRLPYADGALDAAILECVFSLLESPTDAVGELARVIRPGGVLLLSDLYARAGEGITLTGHELLRFVYAEDAVEGFFCGGNFVFTSFTDRTKDLQTMVAQMMMDGTDCDCFDEATIRLLRQIKAGYGIWLFRRI